MPNDSGNNTTNNKNKFPAQGNFSASQNNVGGNLGNIKDIVDKTKNQNIPQHQSNAQNPTGLDAAKKEVAKKGIETAATAANPIAGQVAKAAMNSKLGNKVLNKATNLTKSPIRRFTDFLNKKTEIDEDNIEEEADTGETQSEKDESTSLIPKEITSKVAPFAFIGSFGCLGAILLIAIIASIMLSPIFLVGELLGAVKDGVSGFWDGIVSFFKGCSNEQECQQKEQISFYDTLLKVHDEYEREYEVTLNTELITATLTYYSPMSAMEDLNNSDTLSPSNMVDFKKSEKKIRELASHMVSEGKVCIDSLGNVLAEYKEDEKFEKCPQPTQLTYIDETTKKEVENKVILEERYYLNEEKYKKYLEETFIRKFYFEGKNNDEVNKQIPIVIDDIYSRVEMVKYLNSSENSSTNFVANNSQVLIMDCTGQIELETVSLYEYLQGVLYIEGYAVNRSEEFLKVQAIIAKNYLYAINNATPDSIPTTLKVRSCQMNQLYCNVEEGCHSLNDGKTDSYYTVVSGPDENGTYHRPPINDIATLEKIKRAIDATLTEFIVKDNKFVTTQYRASCTGTCDSTTNILDQKVANEMIKSGSTYKEVLNHFFNGEIKEVSLWTSGYPLDIVHNYVTSAYGWRVHPIKKICRTHGGTDIAAPGDANIYAITDGVVVSNYYHSSYGNVTIIGHGANTNGNYAYYSLYAHQIRLSTHVSVGSTVKAGQVIGNVGSTGTSTGNHLHIEIYTMQNGKKVRQDPVAYFKGVELTGQVGGALYDTEGDCNRCLHSYGAGSC